MKKLTSFLLVLTLCFSPMQLMAMSLSPTVPGAVYSDQTATGVNKPVVQIQQELQQAGIQDVRPTDWYAGSITVLVQSGLLAPTSSGQIQPDANLSFNEGVAVFAKVLGIASKSDTPEQATQKAVEAGLVQSTPSVNRDMNRLEVARLLATALGIQPKQVTPASFPFTDFAGLSQEDMGLLAALYEVGIFKGYEDKTFRPGSILTRAQIAILVDRILGA